MFMTPKEIRDELGDIQKMLTVDDGDVQEVTFKRADLWRINQGLKNIIHSISVLCPIEYELRCWDCGHEYTAVEGSPEVVVCPECGKCTVGLA
jgi:rRNA maturation endonuclease Nob1